MKFRSINNKRLKGDRLRITEPTAMFRDNVQTLYVHEVNQSQVGRIDLVSIEYYGSADYSDLILKYNNISNPFTIAEGDILNIPDRTALKDFKEIKPVGDQKESENPVRQQFLDTKRLTPKDANRVEYLKKKANEKENGAQPLPPNILPEGESNLDIEGDTIIL